MPILALMDDEALLLGTWMFRPKTVYVPIDMSDHEWLLAFGRLHSHL